MKMQIFDQMQKMIIIGKSYTFFLWVLDKSAVFGHFLTIFNCYLKRAAFTPNARPSHDVLTCATPVRKLSDAQKILNYLSHKKV